MIIAVDTGATKTLVAAFEDGRIVRSVKFATPRDQRRYIAEIARASTEVAGGITMAALSVGVAGVVQNDIAVVCKNLDWHNFDILTELQTHFPNTPMWLNNDANLGGVGVAHLLPETPHRLLYIGIGTGLGGGLVIDGRIDQATATGEISDVHFEYNGELARWGAILSGKAIFRDFGVYADQVTDPEQIREVARRISRGLLALIPVLKPEVIAFGGRAGAVFEKFADGVKSELLALPEQYNCQLITAPHPEEIVVYGCYFHATSQLASR